jgi:hypothetical protein
VAHLESFALSNTLSATFEGSDIPTWPIDPSVRSSPQSSLNMPFYGEQEPNTSCLFPENEHGVSPFFDSYLGQSPSVLPPRTSNSVYDSISPENQQLLYVPLILCGVSSLITPQLQYFPFASTSIWVRFQHGQVPTISSNALPSTTSSCTHERHLPSCLLFFPAQVGF